MALLVLPQVCKHGFYPSSEIQAFPGRPDIHLHYEGGSWPELCELGWQTRRKSGKTRHLGTWLGTQESRVSVVGGCNLCPELLTEGYCERK